MLVIQSLIDVYFDQRLWSKFFDKRPRDTTHAESRICDIFSDIIPKKQQLANKLHNPITKKFKKHKVY